MSSEGYNGWSNYETWNVALWIGNDEWSERRAREAAIQAVEYAEGSEPCALHALEDALEVALGPGTWGDEPTTGPAADLLMTAWKRVDWREIAEHYLADALADWKADNVEAEAEAE